MDIDDSPTMTQVGGAKINNNNTAAGSNAANYDMSTHDRSGSHRRHIYSTLGGGKIEYKPMKSKKQSQASSIAAIN